MPFTTVPWECAIVGMLRYVIGDDIAPYTYNDDKLKNLILYSAFMLYKDITFGQSYIFNLSQLTITPDPVICMDFAFINLSVLKAAVILARNVLRAQSGTAGTAIIFKDGQSSYDGRELYKAQLAVLKSAENDFDEAFYQYQFGDTAPGNAILGPFSSDRINFGNAGGFFGEGLVTMGGFGPRRDNAQYSAQGY